MDITASKTYSSAEVANYLGCSQRKVWNLRRELGVGLRIGGAGGYRYDDGDVAKLLAALRPTPEPAPRRRRRRAA